MLNGAVRWVSLVLAGVLLSVTAVAYGSYGAWQRSDFTVLNQALAATGATVRSVEINGWVELDIVPADEMRLEERVRDSFDKLGYNGNQVAIERQQNAYFSQYRGEIHSGDLDLIVISQVIYPNGSKSAEAYTVINAIMRRKDANNGELEQKINRILTEIGHQPRINTCLVGQLDGKLNKNDLKHRLALAFDSIQAVTMDQMFDGDFASITGYTPKIAKFIKVKQKKLNINMAMRYVSSEERTYVIIGSPVITREY